MTLIRLYKERDREAQIYIYGILIALAIILCRIFELGIDYFAGINFADVCIIKETTGIYCPGCFGTRSLIALVHGQFIQSILLNPALPVFVIIAAVFYGSQTIRFVSKEKIKGIRFYNVFIYIEVILLLANCILKNILGD